MILRNTDSGLIFNLLSLLINYEKFIRIIQKEVNMIIKYCSALDINKILVDLDERLNLGILKNNDIIIVLREKLSNFISIGDKTWSNIVFKIGNKILKMGGLEII